MILPLKKVIGGVFALACIQKARGMADRDIPKIKEHWVKRVACMDREIKMRNAFLNELETSRCEEIKADTLKSFSKAINVRREWLSSTEIELSALNKTVKVIGEKTDQFMYLDKNNKFKPVTPEMESLDNEILDMLPDALKQSDAVADRINIFDYNMLAIIGEYNKAKKNPSDLNDLALYRLAKHNKSLAVSIIYSLFRIVSYKTEEDVKDALANMNSKANTYQFALDFAGYTEAIKNSVKADKIDLFKLANNHFHLLFKAYRVNEDIMKIYLDLAEESLSEEGIAQHMDITVEQIIKVLMIEYAIGGHLTDYRRNNLFHNLGNIIDRIGKPADGSASTPENMEKARAKQNEILDALYVLWNETDGKNIGAQEKNIEFLCKQNDISMLEFGNMQRSFISVRWMYRRNRLSPELDSLASQDKAYKKEFFDVSYIHPMFHMYLRCADVRQSADAGITSDQEVFIRRESNTAVVLRPHVVSKMDSKSEQVKNMKDCIRAWFFLCKLEFFVKDEDHEKYCRIIQDFRRYMNKSQYIFSKAEKSEKISKIEKNERNPLQDEQMEIDEDGFTLVI
ncbi:hypothetical protein NEMIN01_0358 [Nematocida minor]|uniref:uncharacterized protein n=1 Tax=Nematocida minor TaxID=1912983 RepID=UPI002220FFC2|nr:uncharacterized protein NEMIN01_0358 [Nematocida minor]KAI5189192.1 hypothetical protein NEMIN01_0358 [Nematocida minor]